MNRTAPLPNGNCAPTDSGTFHEPKYEKSVDISGITTRSGSSQHVSMRDVNCKESPSVFEMMHGLRCADVHECT